MEELKKLFFQYTGKETAEFTELKKGSGSHRRYFRMQASGVDLIGVIGNIREENQAFIALARHFRTQGIRVPHILAASEDSMRYLQEDLGDRLLYDIVAQRRESGDYSPKERALLRKVMEQLPTIQFVGAKGLDFSVCYPEEAFNGRMVDFDLNYFKYCFLKATGIDFNEIALQDDFDVLKRDLLENTGQETFMYRDFQARNVMIRDSEPWFIDFQGGRRGPIYYDVASFVWQARAKYPDDLREELISVYLDALRKYTKVDEDEFRDRLRIFVLFRTLQVLGAYGFRGYYERKSHFIQSVPYAMENIRNLLKTPFKRYPYLSSLLLQLAERPELNMHENDDRLEVRVFSFAFKKGIPADNSGNGGGYVFDCRSILNPGKYQQFCKLTGLDAAVVNFLEENGEAEKFLAHVFPIIDAHVRRFIERGFTNLQVCFGCTGGQHRSVYCAERLALHLSTLFDARIRLVHRELGIEKTF